MKQKNLIAKNPNLEDQIFIKSQEYINSRSDPGGKQIIIAGTTKKTLISPKNHIFFAIFNTRYNVTEFLYNDFTDIDEILRGIQLDKANGHCIFL